MGPQRRININELVFDAVLAVFSLLCHCIPYTPMLKYRHMKPRDKE